MSESPATPAVAAPPTRPVRRGSRVKAAGTAGALLLATATTLAACSTGPTTGDATTAATAPGATGQPSQAGPDGFPVTVDTASGPVTIAAKPERIVSLSPSSTETLFAIGAGPQVVAADEHSTYPPEAPKTTLSGFEPNIEAIIATKPDLLVVANDAGGLVEAMKRVNVPVIISSAPTTIDGGYTGMSVLGQATGNHEKAEAEVARIKQEVASAMAKAPNARVRVYHEVDPGLVAASSNGFVGSVYTAMGAVNIADAADTAKSGYPQLTEEAIVAADPQLIVITDKAGLTAAEVAKRPGWANISAVKNKHIVTVDGDIASRWGPRMPQFVEDVAEALASVQSGSTGTSGSTQSPASTPAATPAPSAA